MTFILQKNYLGHFTIWKENNFPYSLRIEVNYLFLLLIRGSKYQDCLVTETKINVTNLNYAFL